LQPGIYILEAPVSRGVATGAPAFQVGPGDGGTTVNGNGVTLVFTSATPNIPSSYPTGSNNPMMNIDSSATVNLTAPTTGPTAGFVIMGDSTMPLGTGPVGTGFSSSASATTVNLNGVVYLPNGFMSWGGNATTASGCRQFIVNTISLQGTPGLNNNNVCKPIGSIVTLVQ
jgi:hypothetical protein